MSGLHVQGGVVLGSSVRDAVFSSCRWEGARETSLRSRASHVTLLDCFLSPGSAVYCPYIDDGAGPHFLWGCVAHGRIRDPGLVEAMREDNDVSAYLRSKRSEGVLPPGSVTYGLWINEGDVFCSIKH